MQRLLSIQYSYTKSLEGLNMCDIDNNSFNFGPNLVTHIGFRYKCMFYFLNTRYTTVHIDSYIYNLTDQIKYSSDKLYRASTK